MKNCEVTHAQTQPGRATGKGGLGWLKSVDRKHNKENTCDPFVLRLKRTQPTQIGYQIEDIDQETQQLLGTVRSLQAQNDKLQKALDCELREVEQLEEQLIQESSSRPHNGRPSAPQNRSSSTCLIKNYNRALWVAEQEREQKTEELQALKATPAAQEYARQMALIKALETEVAEVTKLRDQHALRAKEETRGRRERFKKKIGERQVAIKKLEKRIAEADEFIASHESNESQQTKRCERLQKRVAAQQKLNGDLRKKIEKLQSGINAYEEYWEDFDEQDLESCAVHAFFLYLVIYLEKHKLTAAFVRDVLEEAVRTDDAETFEQVLTFHLGLRGVEAIKSRLFNLLTFRSTPEMALFKFMGYRERLFKEKGSYRSGLDVPKQGSLFAFLLEKVEEAAVDHEVLLRGVLELDLDGRFYDLGSLGEVPRSNKASLAGCSSKYF